MPKDNSSDPDGSQRVRWWGIARSKSAARTVQVLELLAARRHQPARLRDLSDALDAPRSSVYALLKTLVDYGWVRTDEHRHLLQHWHTSAVGRHHLPRRRPGPAHRAAADQRAECAVGCSPSTHPGRLRGDRHRLPRHSRVDPARPPVQPGGPASHPRSAPQWARRCRPSSRPTTRLSTRTFPPSSPHSPPARRRLPPPLPRAGGGPRPGIRRRRRRRTSSASCAWPSRFLVLLDSGSAGTAVCA